MNKLLATITLLCLPLTSFAEIYSCTSSKGKYINNDLEANLTSGEVYIVDTDRGMRFSLLIDYLGACKKGEITTWNCEISSNSDGVIRIDINEEYDPIRFAFTQTDGYYVSSYVGTCVKI
jgi:hypothetical protein